MTAFHRQQLPSDKSLGSLRYLPAVVVLLAGLSFGYSASRGVDLTDETYYFFHYLYWKEFTLNVTFFGAYFEWPFRLLGQSIPLIRDFGALLLAASGGFFCARLSTFYCNRAGILKFDSAVVIAAGMGFTLSFFGLLATVRAPSYNTLAIVCILVSTGCLLGFLQTGTSPGKRHLYCLFYGLTFSILFFTKPPAALATGLCHALAFLFFRIAWNWHALLIAALYAGFGACINLLYLQITAPNWLGSVVDGVGLLSLMAERPAPTIMLKGIWWYYREASSGYLAFIAGFVLIHSLLLVLARNGRPWLVQFLVLVPVCAVAWGLGTIRSGNFWILAMATWLLYSTELFLRDVRRFNQGDRIAVALIILLFLLPPAFSIGTNIALATHMQLAAVFPLAACMLLIFRLNVSELLSIQTSNLSLAVLCLPALALQLTPWFDQAKTYRLRTPLTEQNVANSRDSRFASVTTDQLTHDELAAFSKLLKGAGFKAEQPILDCAGDGPGLAYSVGGKPVGVAWVFGACEATPTTTRYLLAHVNGSLLKRAWIFTSSEIPTPVLSKVAMLAERLGATCHQFVGNMELHPTYTYARSDPLAKKKAYFIEIWKPMETCALAH